MGLFFSTPRQSGLILESGFIIEWAYFFQPFSNNFDTSVY
jgi:hypothetical protein